MKFLRSKRGLALLSLAMLLVMFLVRPGADRLRARIVRSVSMALGRQVEVGSVNLRLLPQPGFDLTKFVVYDDPAFSAEPMLRAEDVTAVVRMTSLFRGRLEIARLSLTEPSLNLVRNQNGDWNLDHLLEKAAQVQVAPTGKARTESRPGFPYIQADHARINVKIGAEKKPYALTDAQFSFWQDSENTWGMRLKAQPIRTDLRVSDTGSLKVEGTWGRAASLSQTPVRFSLQWDRAQLGQVSQLLYGADRGWRGALRVNASIIGTPANLAIKSQAAIEDFRRYDLWSGSSITLAAQCEGRYSSPERAFPQISCRAPVGDGLVTLDGNASASGGNRQYDLVLIAQHVPARSLAGLVRHAKKDLPDDLAVEGSVDGNVRFHREGNGVQWIGGGEATDFHFASATTGVDVLLEHIPFRVTTSPEPEIVNVAKGSRQLAFLSQARVVIGPFDLLLGKNSGATVDGWLSRTGYGLSIAGDAQIKRLLQVAHTVGVPTPSLAANGLAKVNLEVAGDWAGFQPPKATGQAQLRTVRAEIRGLDAPVEISSATILLTPSETRVQALTATIADMTLHGSLVVPRPCAGPDRCPVQFDLSADKISSAEIAQLLIPHPRSKPWYQFLSLLPQAAPTYLGHLQAEGKLSANRLVIHALEANRASANVTVRDGKVALSALRGDIFGGRHLGDWKIDLTVRPPRFTGHGTVEKAALGELASAMHDSWISGTAIGSYKFTASGLSISDLIYSAEASMDVQVRDGMLPHLVLTGGSGPVQVHRLAATLTLQDGKLEITGGRLDTASGAYLVSGNASLGRSLDLRLMHSATHGFNVSGTLAEPHIVSLTLPETQAALKP